MKKLFLLIFFFVSFLFLASPARGACSSCQRASQAGGIFSDPAYSQSTNNFSSGQMVYVRVETAGAGERKNELQVLDAEKEIIQAMSMNKSGAGPYVYTASFRAPEASGVYYVDIKIEGEGSSFASQKNINVDGGGGASSVSSVAKSIVGQEPQVEIFSPSPPTPTPTPKSQIEVEEGGPAGITKSYPPEENRSFFNRLNSFQLGFIEFFRKIFSYLTASLK